MFFYVIWIAVLVKFVLVVRKSLRPLYLADLRFNAYGFYEFHEKLSSFSFEKFTKPTIFKKFISEINDLSSAVITVLADPKSFFYFCFFPLARKINTISWKFVICIVVEKVEIVKCLNCRNEDRFAFSEIFLN